MPQKLVIVHNAKQSTLDPRRWKSRLPIKGVNRLDFEKPIVVQALVYSRTLSGPQVSQTIRELIGGIEPGATFIDFGCGPGMIVNHFAAELGKVYVLDASRGMLAEAVKNLPGENVTFINGDIHTAGMLIPEEADYGLLSGNLHLLTNLPLAISQIRHVIKPGGKLIIVTHVQYNTSTNDPGFLPSLIDEVREMRPDLTPDGLRLPILTERELLEKISIIQGIGFRVSVHEDITNAVATPTVLGRVPTVTIVDRLRILQPGVSEKELEIRADTVMQQLYRGHTTEVYIVCAKLA